MSPLVALDIAAHEFTHNVTAFSAALKYQGESGAINEGFSDLFSVAVKYFADSTNYAWTIGEDVMF